MEQEKRERKGNSKSAALQYVFIQVVLNNRVLNTLHRNTEQVRIRRVGEMYVDFPIRCAVETSELLGKVLLCRFYVGLTSMIVGEVVLDRLLRELFSEEIHLVEEQYYRRLAEPWKAQDGLEKH